MKAIVYVRVSTQDQNPRLQLRDCEEFCSRNHLTIVEVIEEQKSGFRKARRPGWEKVILTASKRQVDAVVLWRFDRCFRNRQLFVKFMREMFEVYHIRVYSVTEPWVMTLWEMISHLPEIPEPWDVVIKDLMQTFWRSTLQIVGQLAEEESRKKGERVRLAIDREEQSKAGRAVSYKGNRWGRKPLSPRVAEEVLRLRSEGLSIREITEQVYYYDKSNNRKKLSHSGVHKILSRNGSTAPEVSMAVNKRDN